MYFCFIDYAKAFDFGYTFLKQFKYAKKLKENLLWRLLDFQGVVVGVSYF